MAALEELLPRAMAPFADAKPPGLIFYQAGVDVAKADQLGRLHLSRHGLIERTRSVMRHAAAAGAPVVVTMGGGYPKDLSPASDDFKGLVSRHVDVYTEVAVAAATARP
jgi:acetoin utilization deacetylase AcuC-like enzyme